MYGQSQKLLVGLNNRPGVHFKGQPVASLHWKYVVQVGSHGSAYRPGLSLEQCALASTGQPVADEATVTCGRYSTGMDWIVDQIYGRSNDLIFSNRPRDKNEMRAYNKGNVGPASYHSPITMIIKMLRMKKSTSLW